MMLRGYYWHSAGMWHPAMLGGTMQNIGLVWQETCLGTGVTYLPVCLGNLPYWV